jgi:hypothetical protein
MRHIYGKTIFCTSKTKVKNHYLEFAVKIIPNKPKKGFATATLELLETINKVGGYYPWQIIDRVLSKFLGKQIDKAFAYYCGWN